MLKLPLLAALLLAFASTSFAQTPQVTPEAASADKVDQLFAQWDKRDAPGCALAVIKDGHIIYERGYGMASLELSVPNTPATVFNVGSISKQFTAMAVVMLAEQRKLSLDDDVRKYIPEVPDFGTPITIRHLIHHTSGLRDFLEMLEMAGWRADDVETEQDVLDMVARQRTLNHRPGNEYLYTNTGYVLLSVVVKRVSGRPLGEFAEANIFQPLGMTHTHFYGDHTAVVRGLAQGYSPNGDGTFLKNMPDDDLIGSGGLFTTVEDLARWDQNFYERKVGGQAVIEQMLAPGVLNDGTKIAYAFGLNVGPPYKGLETIFHNGSRGGYRGMLQRFPAQHFSVALLCNVRIAVDPLAARVADIYLADQLKPAATNQGNVVTAPADAVKVSEKELSGVAGLYWNPVADTVRRVYVKDGKLMYMRAPGNESELAPLGGNRFRMLGVRNKVEIVFKSPRAAAPPQMFFSQDGGKPSVQEFVRPASYTPQQLVEFAGRYESAEVGATYSISPQGAGLMLRTGNWGDFLLAPRFADSFENQAEMGSLIFTRDGKNRVSGFIIRSGKVKNLRFDKIK